ncbi:MAG: hypothetical protein AMXMBFR13_43520 [Phycisphaerae bacterium]
MILAVVVPTVLILLGILIWRALRGGRLAQCTLGVLGVGVLVIAGTHFWSAQPKMVAPPPILSPDPLLGAGEPITFSGRVHWEGLADARERVEATRGRVHATAERMRATADQIRAAATEARREGEAMAVSARAGVNAARAAAQIVGEAGENLEPDVYASGRAGVLAVAKSLLERLDEVIPEGVKLDKVWISGETNEDLLKDVAQVVRPQVGNTDVVVNWDAPTSRPAEMEAGHVMLRVDGRSGGDGETLPGSSDLALIGQRRSIHRQVHSAGKLWLSNLGAHASIHGGGKRLVASSGLQANPQGAEDQSQAYAAQMLLPYAQQAVQQYNTRHHRESLREDDRQRLQEQLRQDLRVGRFVEDQFAQRFQKSYGTIYQHHLLLKIDDVEMASAAARYAEELYTIRQAQSSGVRWKVLSTAGLIALICVVYLFLNAATKGYYAWSLRTAGAVAVIGGLIVLAAVA